MTDILDLLKKKGELSSTAYELVMRYIEKWQLSPFEVMLETHIFSEDRLADQLADVYQAQRVLSIDEMDLSSETFQFLDYQQAKKLRCMLIKSEDAVHLLAVVADPTDQNLQDFLDSLSVQCELAIAERTTLDEAIERYYPIEQQIPSLFRKRMKQDKEKS